MCERVETFHPLKPNILLGEDEINHESSSQEAPPIELSNRNEVFDLRARRTKLWNMQAGIKMGGSLWENYIISPSLLMIKLIH